ncbi:MAG: metallophosphoesterase [Atribacterota bacterium]|nr:metallophosphoesterase [Atribacterota bacterium]MDD4895173.1 metallophosphoesterase [Atribacterota bacterium]MDD5636944.1 metallophosphoesterase [Atribacterota bacterium]
MNLKLGMISDLHARKNKWFMQRKLIQQIMEFFISRQVDAVIDLGDRIEGTSCLEDEELTMIIRQELEHFNMKVFYLYGNHDLFYVNKSMLNSILKKKNSYEIAKLKDFLLLILDSNDGQSAFVSRRQIDWMCKVLTENNSPVLIFSHHPIFAIDISEHAYFSLHPNEAIVNNFHEVQSCILRNPKVIGVFQGHIHQLLKKSISGKIFGINPPLHDSQDKNFPEGGIAITDITFPGTIKVSYFRVTTKGNEYLFPEMEDLEFQLECN